MILFSIKEVFGISYLVFYVRYETIINHAKPLVTPEQTLLQIEILEKGIERLK